MIFSSSVLRHFVSSDPGHERETINSIFFFLFISTPGRYEKCRPLSLSLSLHRRYIRTSNSGLCSRLLQPRCTNYLRPSPSNLLAFAEGHPSGPTIKEGTLRCNLSGAILRNYRGPRAGTKYKIVFRPLDQCGGR